MKKLVILFFLVINFLPIFSVNDNKSADASSLALGGASVATNNVYAAYNNQALLSLRESTTIATSYLQSFAINDIRVMAAVPVSFGTFGFNISRLGTSNYAEYKFGAAYARSFGDKFGAALQADLLSVMPSPIDKTSYLFTAELGIWYRPIEDLTVGLHAYNFINAKYKFAYYKESVPVNLKLGLSYSILNNFIISGEVENNSLYGTSVRGGFEYKIVDMVVFRAGGASNPALASLGVGVIMKKLRIDVTGQAVRYIGKNGSISLSYAF